MQLHYHVEKIVVIEIDNLQVYVSLQHKSMHHNSETDKDIHQQLYSAFYKNKNKKCVPAMMRAIDAGQKSRHFLI